MAAPPPVLTLAVDKGPRKGESRQCRAGKALRVGRVVKGNDLAVRDVGASQQHLAIEFLPPPAARWAVSDLGSSNGSLLNGAPLVPSIPAPLSHGDLIKIGESTVLAVSISSDSDPNPGDAANPGTRRSSRHAAASVVVEEEKLLAVTGRVTRKKAAAAAAAAVAPPPEILEAENEEPHTAALVGEDAKSRAVTRRGGRKKAAVAEPPEEMEEAAEATRRGGRKKAGEPPQPEKDEGKEEAVVLPRRGRRKKAADPPELERGDEDKEEEAPVVTRRGGRKKDVAVVASPPLPPNTRSRRSRGRSKKKAVLEEEDMEEHVENEAAAPSTLKIGKGGEEEKESEVAARYGEVEVTAALDEELPKERANAQHPASDDGGDKEKGGREEEEGGRRELLGSEGVVVDREKVQEHAQRSSMETMTLGEWFDRMEKYLPRMITEAADEMIAKLEERHQQYHEYISTLRE